MINKNISDFLYIKVDIRKITCVKLNKMNRKQFFFVHLIKKISSNKSKN
jgi:hypothetical protein